MFNPLGNTDCILLLALVDSVVLYENNKLFVGFN